MICRRRPGSGTPVQGTRTLVDHLEHARSPEVLVSASAVGIYGDRGDELLEDDASAGTGFSRSPRHGKRKRTGPPRSGSAW